jgi:hypothetical protein
MEHANVAGLLLTYGPLGVMVLLYTLGVIVPRSAVERVEHENEILRRASDRDRDTARDAVAQLSVANQLLGEFRAIALRRAAGIPEPPWSPPGTFPGPHQLPPGPSQGE